MLEFIRHFIRIFVILPLATPLCAAAVIFDWAIGDKRACDTIIEFYIESIILGRTL